MAPAHGPAATTAPGEAHGASQAASPGEPSPPGGPWEQSLLTGGSGPPRQGRGASKVQSGFRSQWRFTPGGAGCAPGPATAAVRTPDTVTWARGLSSPSGRPGSGLTHRKALPFPA